MAGYFPAGHSDLHSEPSRYPSAKQTVQAFAEPEQSLQLESHGSHVLAVSFLNFCQPQFGRQSVPSKKYGCLQPLQRCMPKPKHEVQFALQSSHRFFSSQKNWFAAQPPSTVVLVVVDSLLIVVVVVALALVVVDVSVLVVLVASVVVVASPAPPAPSVVAMVLAVVVVSPAGSGVVVVVASSK